MKDTLKEEAPDLAAFAAQAPPQPATRGLLIDLVSAIVESQVAATLSIGVSVGVLGFGACLAVWLRIPLGAKPILGFAGAYIAALVGIAAILAALWAVAFVFVVEPREALRWVPVPRQTFKDYDNYLKEADNERPGMNRLTIVTDVKGGVLRALTLRLVLWVVGFRARRNVEGRLMGVETIHFAQWRLVDGGRRLLFMSNYDGRALDYFADFSDNAAPGLNAIWGNTEGFPPTTAFLGNGARDLEEFQNAARVHQIATDVWYCGYPTRRFTTRRINDNWRIHQLLNGYPTPSEVDEWLDMLEGRPP